MLAKSASEHTQGHDHQFVGTPLQNQLPHWVSPRSGRSSATRVPMLAIPRHGVPVSALRLRSGITSR